MRILNWSNEKNLKPYITQSLAPDTNTTSSWFSILIGKNGSKKSLLLRLLLEASLGNSALRLNGHKTIYPSIEVTPSRNSISSVIAISGTPFDRFRRLNQLTTTDSSISDKKYIYLGQTSINGTTGLTQTVRTLSHILLEKNDTKLPLSTRKIFEFLDLEPRISVELRRHTSINESKGDSVKSSSSKRQFSEANFESKLSGIAIYLQTLYIKMESKKVQNKVEISQEIKFLEVLIKDKETLKTWLINMPTRIEYALNDKDDRQKSNLHHQNLNYSINHLIAAGLVVASHITFSRIDPSGTAHELIDSDLSSGQWHLASSMLGLALAAKDNSLVLIDEPENSLHPEWQSAYIELLNDMLHDVSGCHVIIATHSPLVASGVKVANGNAMRLVREDSYPLGIQIVPQELAYGWDASDVYHDVFELTSTRATSFIKKINRALQIVGNGRKPDEMHELHEIVTSLKTVSSALPEQDTMRQIIDALESTCNKLREGGK